MDDLEQGNGILLGVDGWKHIGCLNFALQTRRALMEDDDVDTSHVLLVLVELCVAFLSLIPEVCFNFKDRKEWPIGVVWVWLRSGDRRDGDGDRHHCSDCF